jgi:hypothetical protein
MAININKLSKRYLSGQAITYFFLSILLIMKTASLTSDPYKADTPFFYIGKLGSMPFPMINSHIDLIYWIMFILAFVFLGFSVFFFAILFGKRYLCKVTGFALKIAPLFDFFVLISFILSLATGLASVLTNIHNTVITGIFSYAGILIFFAFFVRVLLDLGDSEKTHSSYKCKYSISEMNRDSLPCL